MGVVVLSQSQKSSGLKKSIWTHKQYNYLPTPSEVEITVLEFPLCLPSNHPRELVQLSYTCDTDVCTCINKARL